MGFGDIFKSILGAGASLIPGVGPVVGPLVQAGLAGVGGALENTAGARTTTMTPTLAPEYKTLADLLRSRAEDRLRSTTDLSGLTANTVSGINDAFAGLQTSANNNLTARGLATSPVAGMVDQNLDLARGGRIVDFLNTLPQLQRQYQNEDMANAQNVLNLGRGTTSVGPGSVAGGAFNSVAKMLAYLNGAGAFEGNAPKTSGGSGFPLGDIFGMGMT